MASAVGTSTSPAALPRAGSPEKPAIWIRCRRYFPRRRSAVAFQVRREEASPG